MILSLAAAIATYRSYSRLNFAFRPVPANTILHWSTRNILLSFCFPPGCSELSEQRNASRSSIAFHITILIFVYTALVTGSIGTNVSTNAYPLLAFSITVYSSLPIEPREDGERRSEILNLALIPCAHLEICLCYASGYGLSFIPIHMLPCPRGNYAGMLNYEGTLRRETLPPFSNHVQDSVRLCIGPDLFLSPLPLAEHSHSPPPTLPRSSTPGTKITQFRPSNINFLWCKMDRKCQQAFTFCHASANPSPRS